MIEYLCNGLAVKEDHAFDILANAYLLAGHADLEELRIIWNARGTSEAARDTIFEMSGYTLEIFTEEEL